MKRIILILLLVLVVALGSQPTTAQLDDEVKTIVLIGGDPTVPAGGWTYPHIHDSYEWGENVTVIGWELAAHWTPSLHYDLTPGCLESLAHLSSSDTRFSAGEIGHVSALTRVVHVTTGTFLIVGDTTQRVGKMLPTGKGIYFNDGEMIYLIGNGDARGLTSGTLSACAWAIVYYVLR